MVPGESELRAQLAEDKAQEAQQAENAQRKLELERAKARAAKAEEEKRINAPLGAVSQRQLSAPVAAGTIPHSSYVSVGAFAITLACCFVASAILVWSRVVTPLRAELQTTQQKLMAVENKLDGLTTVVNRNAETANRTTASKLVPTVSGIASRAKSRWNHYPTALSRWRR